MTLAALADLAEVMGTLGVIASLVFVGVQLHQNTKQMRRAEANKAFEQASQLRELVIGNREVADLLVSGMSGKPLDPTDEVRLHAFFSEMTYVALQTWDRSRYGLTTIGDFESAVTPVMAIYMSSPRAVAWWTRSKSQFPAEFVALLEEKIPALRAQTLAPSATAPQGAVGAVAPPADAG